MWELFFLISFLVNVIGLFYIRWLLKTLATINQDVGNLNDMIFDFNSHIKSVYELEMFYGDETLKFLIDHTVSIGNILEDYEDPEFFLEEFEEEDVPQQEENTNAETPEPQQKDVFYAGTRRRDS